MPVGGFVSSGSVEDRKHRGVNNDRHSDAMHCTKRRLRDAIEAQEMLEKAFKDYTKGIDPVWVHPCPLWSDMKNLQFRFVDSKTNPESRSGTLSMTMRPNCSPPPKAILQHMTIGISEIKGSHAVSRT